MTSRVMPAVPAEACLEALKERGFNFFCGVADSTVAALIEALSRDPVGYRGMAREDLAVGLASGAYLAGGWPCVLMQNSGLGYCLNALTSLNLIYKIPLLLIVGYRGFPGRPDAPEHQVMGAHCEQLLREVGIPLWVPAERSAVIGDLGKADESMRRLRVPAALFIRPGILEAVKSEE